MLRDSPVLHVWAPEIVLGLAQRPRRFNWLLDNIAGISDRVLSVRLRELEEAGLIKRDVDPGPPVRVYYRLTEAATPYVGPLEQLAAIDSGSEHQEAAVG